MESTNPFEKRYKEIVFLLWSTSAEYRCGLSSSHCNIGNAKAPVFCFTAIIFGQGRKIRRRCRTMKKKRNVARTKPEYDEKITKSFQEFSSFSSAASCSAVSSSSSIPFPESSPRPDFRTNSFVSLPESDDIVRQLLVYRMEKKFNSQIKSVLSTSLKNK